MAWMKHFQGNAPRVCAGDVGLWLDLTTLSPWAFVLTENLSSITFCTASLPIPPG